MKLWQSIGVDVRRIPDVGPLLLAYETPPRHYHNLRHIRHCLNELDAARELGDNPAAIELAIWFHDVVYDPTRNDNEERSADIASLFLREAGVDEPQTQKVRDLILTTKHNQTPADNDSRLLVDIDLSILGQPADTFDEYERAIRLEYRHVSAEAFRAGRLAVLNSFLARPRIYLTDPLRHRYETAARMNLQRSIEHLRG